MMDERCLDDSKNFQNVLIFSSFTRFLKYFSCILIKISYHLFASKGFGSNVEICLLRRQRNIDRAETLRIDQNVIKFLR